jgi:hypothetical protein
MKDCMHPGLTRGHLSWYLRYDGERGCLYSLSLHIFGHLGVASNGYESNSSLIGVMYQHPQFAVDGEMASDFLPSEVRLRCICRRAVQPGCCVEWGLAVALVLHTVGPLTSWLAGTWLASMDNARMLELLVVYKG